MSEETDQFRAAVESGLQAEFGCAECDAERVAAAVARARDADGEFDWSPSFVVEKLTDAPRDRSVPGKWNWLLEYLGGPESDRAEYRLED